MKKNFKILSAAILAVSMLFAVSCKKDAELSVEKVKKWGDTNINHGNGILRINNDTKHSIDWWVLTDMEGRVLDPTTDHFEVRALSTGDLKNPSAATKDLTYRATIASNETAHIQFDTNFLKDQKDIIVWTHSLDSKEVKLNNTKYALNKLTCRGKIDITPDSGRLILASDYPEYVKPVGTIEVTCNETKHNSSKKGCTPGKWHGVYDVTEIWPLVKTSDGVSTGYEALDGLKMKTTIKEGQTVEVIYPQASEYLAVCQPNRFNKDAASGSGKYEGDNTSYNGKDYEIVEDQAKKDQDGWYWCVKTENAQAHTLNQAVTTSQCKSYFKKDGSITDGSNAAYAIPIIYINEADILDGSDIK